MHQSNASRVYLFLRGITSLASVVMFTTYTAYYVQVIGLNPLQLVLVGTVLETTVMFFEIPTGIVADSYSRRLSVIIGVFTLGIGYLSNGALPYLKPLLSSWGLSLFAGLLLGEMIVGIGWTFISGALNAWITDEVGEGKVGPLFLRANQIGQAIALIGIPLSVVLASVSLHIPYLVGGGLYLSLGVLLLMVMKETNYHPQPSERDAPLAALGKTVVQSIAMVRSHPILMLMIAAGIFAGAASEGFDRLWQAFFLQAFTFPRIGELQPVVWFGLISGIRSVLSIIATQATRRRLDTSNQRAVVSALKLLTVLRVGCLISFALAGNFAWALFSYLGVSVLATLIEPLFDTWVNQNLDSRVRATVLSMMGQADALGQTAGGPAVGLVGTRFSLRTSMLMVAALLLPSLKVYSTAIKRHDEAGRSVSRHNASSEV